MNKTALQNYCLQAMGVTQWKLREAPKAKQFPYLFCLPAAKNALTEEEKQLLQRLMQALQWPEQQVAIKFFSPEERLSFHEKLFEMSSQKTVIFGQELAEQLGLNFPQRIREFSQPFVHAIAVVSSLEQLLTDKGEKKQTWQTLQDFINR